ncbi:Hypothetical predicted protein [Marmota monax]|uniref:Uncharacterized protein n=1 Tax=Marmota monax TaxID=9995 RepID=A0A5E4A8J2_MARMO|nr:Hypothetical predicted protein [Marmota monax]
MHPEPFVQCPLSHSTSRLLPTCPIFSQSQNPMDFSQGVGASLLNASPADMKALSWMFLAGSAAASALFSLDSLRGIQCPGGGCPRLRSFPKMVATASFLTFSALFCPCIRK